MESRSYLYTIVVLYLSMTFAAVAQDHFNIIPVPADIELLDGHYAFETEPDVSVRMVKKGLSGPEAYQLTVTRKGVAIKAQDEAGVFYAMQTLRQMTEDGQVKEIRCCRISDEPRFPYRGLHVDPSRHFRSKEFLKKHIDAMALFKFNRLHLHLTDAAGWRLEIDAYPRLTGFAAWRPQEVWKDWWSGDRLYVEQGTEGAYGGYYTKDDIREILAYAAERHIEVIPEIEMPSHSEEVLAAYPGLGCTGEPYKDSDFCVGNEAVFTFLETVLEEVMDLFPSEYIHIGGDEAGKQHWKTCPKCLARMEEEGLEDVDELQSYLIRRIERFVNSKGRRIIGWDEILQGGLAPDATVMSWRGTEGGIEAMKHGHDVIMTPGRYCYLDHAQDAPFLEPESIGGYLPLDTVYMYEPVEPSMPSDKLHHLLGIQGNLWAEHIVTDRHAEYMYWPRSLAIAETAWSRPEDKDLEDFRRRALGALELLDSKGYNVFDLSEEYGERKLAQTGLDHLAKGCPVTYNDIPWPKYYPAAGEATFTDGVMGGWTYSDGRWQGFLSDIDVTVDLGSVRPVRYVGGTFMQLKGPGVFMPRKVEILVSEDGVDFEHVATVWNELSTDVEALVFRSFDAICDVNARYVRYHAYRSTMRGFMFLDEVVVN